MRSRRPSVLIVPLLVLLAAPPAAAYRPFISTDAAVAAPQEMEIELGYFSLERSNRANTFTTPSVVLNYGVAKNWEAVGEFRLQVSPSVQVADPSLSLKGVLREGILQEKPGPSVAVEVGPLLPSTLPNEGHFGFEGIGIVSAGLGPFTFHINGGGGIDRVDARAFGIWGVIGEFPVVQSFRIVGEIAGEDVRGELPNHAALIGFIWQAAPSVAVDAGLRRGLTDGAPAWQITAGVTFGFRVPWAARPPTE